VKSGGCREKPGHAAGEGASHQCRGRRLLLDEVPQGKRQILDSEIVLAQGTSCRARSGITLHPRVC